MSGTGWLVEDGASRPPLPSAPLRHGEALSLQMGDRLSLEIRTVAGTTEYRVSSRGAFGGFRERGARVFPEGPSGWAQAWLAFGEGDPAAARAYVAKLSSSSTKEGYASNRAALDALSLLAKISNLELIGGFGTDSLNLGSHYDLYFTFDTVVVAETASATTMGTLDYVDLLALKVDGPGAVTTGGGFIGGGFGVTGAVEGMIVASVLNAITTRKTVQTIVEVQDTHRDMLFLHTTHTPDRMRAMLKPVEARLRTYKRSADSNQRQEVQEVDPLARLERLVALHGSGALTQSEFETAKQRILADLFE
jgi:hypothetical protein